MQKLLTFEECIHKDLKNAETREVFKLYILKDKNQDDATSGIL